MLRSLARRFLMSRAVVRFVAWAMRPSDEELRAMFRLLDDLSAPFPLPGEDVSPPRARMH